MKSNMNNDNNTVPTLTVIIQEWFEVNSAKRACHHTSVIHYRCAVRCATRVLYKVMNIFSDLPNDVNQANNEEFYVAQAGAEEGLEEGRGT